MKDRKEVGLIEVVGPVSAVQESIVFLLVFFTNSLMWAFQVKLSLIVIPSNLALFTTSISLSSMDTESKASGFRENEILNSLHLSGFSTTLFLRDHSINSSVIPLARVTGISLLNYLRGGCVVNKYPH